MSDRYPARITIGGNITQANYDKLLTLLDGCDEVEECTGAGLIADDYQATNGVMNDVEEFCRVHGLTYVRCSEAFCEWSGCACWWQPGMPAPKECDAAQNGEPVVAVRDIRDRIDCDGGSLIAFLEEHTPCDVPPLVITDAVPVS